MWNTNGLNTFMTWKYHTIEELDFMQNFVRHSTLTRTDVCWSCVDCNDIFKEEHEKKI